MNPLSCRWPAALAAAASLVVSGETFGQCTLSASDLVFDNYNIFNDGDTFGVGDVVVTCDAQVRYTITLNAGSNSTTFLPRILKSPSGDALGYNLFQNQSYAIAWDNGTNVYTGTGSGTAQHIPVYGRIPARQTSVRVGTYTDRITVSITTN